MFRSDVLVVEHGHLLVGAVGAGVAVPTTLPAEIKPALGAGSEALRLLSADAAHLLHGLKMYFVVYKFFYPIL